MSCALTQSYGLDCRDGIGGVREIYIIELGNIATCLSTSGTVTTITLSGGKKFWTYALEKETAQFTQKIMINEQNGTLYYEQDLDFTIRKLAASLRNEIRLLAQNRLGIIVKDRNGAYWTCGFGATTADGSAAVVGQGNGAEMVNSEDGTGKAMGDLNGYKLKFHAKEELPSLQISSSIIAALLN